MQLIALSVRADITCSSHKKGSSQFLHVRTVYLLEHAHAHLALQKGSTRKQRRTYFRCYWELQGGIANKPICGMLVLWIYFTFLKVENLNYGMFNSTSVIYY